MNSLDLRSKSRSTQYFGISTSMTDPTRNRLSEISRLTKASVPERSENSRRPISSPGQNTCQITGNGSVLLPSPDYPSKKTSSGSEIRSMALFYRDYQQHKKGPSIFSSNMSSQIWTRRKIDYGYIKWDSQKGRNTNRTGRYRVE